MFFKSLFKLILSATALGITVLLFASCNALRSEVEGTTENTIVLSTTAEAEVSVAQQIDNDEVADTYVILDDENSVVKGEGAVFEDSVLTVTKGGTYSIKGKLTDGKILVNSNDEEKKVKLLFDGVDISCSTDAPVYVENSPRETIIILSEGSENRVSDTARSAPEDESAEYATAAIYSKDDLQIEGSGRLYVTGNFNKGIFSKNDIDIRGGYLEITSVDDGIRGKESVEISDGTVVITSGGDGIRTSETVETDKGDILISGGNIKITSDLDGIQSVRNAEITGGTIEIVSGGGATGDISSDEAMPGGMGGGHGGRPGGNKGNGASPGFFGGPPVPDSSTIEENSNDTPSTKGIKADGSLSFNGGEVSISSLDDSIHGTDISFGGGKYALESDDDGIHADESILVDGGEIDIANSFEGIEGRTIEIDGGEITLRAVDDGINAAGEDVGMMEDETCYVKMTGGYMHINADGDGVDSNGSVTLEDGTLIVFGPTSGGNGALDYAGQFTVSGGTLLALGSAGMAQSVTSQDGAGVLAFRFSQNADTLTAITDEDGNLSIAFSSDKSFDTVVYAGEKVDSGEVYSIYQGGRITGDVKNGVCMNGTYVDGELLGSLDKSA